MSRIAEDNTGRTERRPPVEAASKFLLVPAPMIVGVVAMMVARIVGVVAMMITMIVAVVAMMVTAVIAMMVVVMMVAVPSCGWDRAAGRDCANNT
jgi:hypothetical protein